MWGVSRVRFSSTAALGYAGTLTATTPGGASASVQLWVFDKSRGTDFEIKSTDAVGNAGDTVTVTTTFTNRGPSPQPWWGIGDFHLTNGHVVATHGCKPAVLSGNTWECAHTRPTKVGESVTISYDIVLDKQPVPGDSGWFALLTYLTDPNHGNNSIYFRILSPATAAGNQGGGSQQGGASQPTSASGADPQPDPNPSPSSEPISTSSATPTTEPTTEVVAADIPESPVSTIRVWVITVGTAVPAAALVAAAIVLPRRRDAARSRAASLGPEELTVTPAEIDD
jgi:hypothetical protein